VEAAAGPNRPQGREEPALDLQEGLGPVAIDHGPGDVIDWNKGQTDDFPNPSSEQGTQELKSDSTPDSPPMSFAAILAEIPRLSFAERQEWVRSAIAVDDAKLTAEENGNRGQELMALD